jgi:hypothetical protein
MDSNPFSVLQDATAAPSLQSSDADIDDDPVRSSVLAWVLQLTLFTAIEAAASWRPLKTL